MAGSMYQPATPFRPHDFCYCLMRMTSFVPSNAIGVQLKLIYPFNCFIQTKLNSSSTGAKGSVLFPVVLTVCPIECMGKSLPVLLRLATKWDSPCLNVLLSCILSVHVWRYQLVVHIQVPVISLQWLGCLVMKPMCLHFKPAHFQFLVKICMHASFLLLIYPSVDQ